MKHVAEHRVGTNPEWTLRLPRGSTVLGLHVKSQDIALVVLEDDDHRSDLVGRRVLCVRDGDILPPDVSYIGTASWGSQQVHFFLDLVEHPL